MPTDQFSLCLKCTQEREKLTKCNVGLQWRPEIPTPTVFSPLYFILFRAESMVGEGFNWNETLRLLTNR